MLIELHASWGRFMRRCRRRRRRLIIAPLCDDYYFDWRLSFLQQQQQQLIFKLQFVFSQRTQLIGQY